jgi:hypothetical protein
MLNPVKCLVNTGGTLLEAVVIDISIGGVGILPYEGPGLLRAGQTYHGCRIDLPGVGTFAVSLNVCSTFDVELKRGRLTYRAGCQFIDLSPSVETEIQRTSSAGNGNGGPAIPEAVKQKRDDPSRLLHNRRSNPTSISPWPADATPTSQGPCQEEPECQVQARWWPQGLSPIRKRGT